MSERFLEILIKGARQLGIELDNSMQESFLLYYNELKRWSKAYNLTALKRQEDIATRLFLDSMAFSLFFPSTLRRAIDIGSGAGFPGLVLSILYPEVEMVLLEPSRKKATFLTAIKKKLSLKRVSIFDRTVQEYCSEQNKTFELITTKALFSAKELIKKTRPLQAKGTILLLSKGPSYSDELAQLREITGYEVTHRTVEIPFTNLIRHFILIKRVQ